MAKGLSEAVLEEGRSYLDSYLTLVHKFKMIWILTQASATIGLTHPRICETMSVEVLSWPSPSPS